LAGKDSWVSILFFERGKEQVVPLNLSSLGKKDWGMIPVGWKLPIADQGNFFDKVCASWKIIFFFFLFYFLLKKGK
jgi:hypothetical protein